MISAPFGKSYYLLGNDAIVEGAITAGCRFYAGYPITPSTEIMERIAVRFNSINGVFMQMEDEIASICAAIGASWAGAKAMTATSGPGFSLMQEAIGYAAMTETPVVVVDIQRAGPGTGQATRVASGDIMQAKWGSHGDYQIIAISPWSVQELYDQTIKAFNLAERFRVPVIILGEEVLAHLRERVNVRAAVEIIDRIKKPGAPPFYCENGEVPPMPAFGEGEKVLVTGSTHDGWGISKLDDPKVQAQLVLRLHNKIMNNREKIIEYDVYHIEDADIVIISYGFTARSSLFAIEKIRKNGIKVGMVRLKTLWPFADRIIREIGSKVKKIFIPEMNMGQVAGEVMKYARCDVISYSQTNGEVIHPNVIIEELKKL